MAESLTENVEQKLYTASDYVGAANLLTTIVSELVQQGDLSSATTAMKSVNLLLEKANQIVQQMSSLV